MSDTPDTHPTDTVPGEPAPQQPVPSAANPSAVPGPAAPPGVETPEAIEAGASVTVPEGMTPTPDSTPGMIPADQVGDTPTPEGEVRPVDTSAQVDTDPEGDRVKEGHVSEVDVPDSTVATAGDLRAAGYTVDPRLADDEVPTAFMADSPTPPGEIRPVLIPQSDQSRRLTPMQYLEETQGVDPDATPPPSTPPLPTPPPHTHKESRDPVTTKEGDES